MFVHYWHLEICFILITLKLFSIGFTVDSAIYTRLAMVISKLLVTHGF